MPAVPHEDVTRLLGAAAEGDRAAMDRLLPHVYDELRALAASFFRKQRGDHTLQPTALVHEAFVRLMGDPQRAWSGRKHFFDVAALAMRQLLADHARRQAALKRGGGAMQVTLEGLATPSGATDEVDVVALHMALERLQALDERQARVVELRFLAGLTVNEAADVLGISPRTVKLDWQMARAWLRRELSAGFPA